MLEGRMTAERQKQRPRVHTKRRQLARSADCSQRRPQAGRMNDERTEHECTREVGMQSSPNAQHYRQG